MDDRPYTAPLRPGGKFRRGDPVDLVRGQGTREDTDKPKDGRIMGILPSGDYTIEILAADGLQTFGLEYILTVTGAYKLGNFRVSIPDLVTSLGSFPITLSRTYDSMEPAAGDFGVGWRMSLSASVSDFPKESEGDGLLGLFTGEAFKDGSRVVVTKPDGKRVGFSFVPTSGGFPGLTFKPGFQPDPGVKDTLRAEGATALFNFGGNYNEFIVPYNPDVYVLTTPEQVSYRISETEGLLQIVSPSGLAIDVTPDGLIASNGEGLDFARDEAGRITTITQYSADGVDVGTFTYTYDALGNLIAVTNQLGHTATYAYENATHPHYLTALHDANGDPVTRNVYDEDGRMVTRMRWPRLKIWLSQPTRNRTLTTLPGERSTSWRNPSR